jgi:2-(3-amino-3-carboxypropyl)histidine synthase
MYNLELDKLSKEIKDSKAEKVLIQLPDGLKPKAKEIVKQLEKETKAEIFIWLGDCFGACDLPLNVKNLGVDVLVQFGHNKFNKKIWDK